MNGSLRVYYIGLGSQTYFDSTQNNPEIFNHFNEINREVIAGFEIIVLADQFGQNCI